MKKTIPRTKLWNRPDYAVWSLSTNDASGNPNMNICTYVVPVSMQPKAFLVALYDDTKTLANVLDSKRGVLQLLSTNQGHLIRRFGKQSGNDVDKFKTLKDTTVTVAGHTVLADCLGYVVLDFGHTYPGGDHVLGYGTVVEHKNLHSGVVMTTHWLKEKKYIL